jgi:hypothetical protein
MLSSERHKDLRTSFIFARGSFEIDWIELALQLGWCIPYHCEVMLEVFRKHQAAQWSSVAMHFSEKGCSIGSTRSLNRLPNRFSTLSHSRRLALVVGLTGLSRLGSGRGRLVGRLPLCFCCVVCPVVVVLVLLVCCWGVRASGRLPSCGFGGSLGFWRRSWLGSLVGPGAPALAVRGVHPLGAAAPRPLPGFGPLGPVGGAAALGRWGFSPTDLSSLTLMVAF